MRRARRKLALATDTLRAHACMVANKSDELLLPPVIPEDRTRLARAITLLGCRARAELGTSARAELTELVGRYPDAATALSWKRSLKQVRDDEIFDRDRCAS